MTRLLFLPDEHTLIQLDSPLAPEDLIQSVQNGLWIPPEPYHESRRRLQAAKLGTTVVIGRFFGPEPGAARPRAGVRLTYRQRQVLHGLAEGLTTRQLAARLKVNHRTVEHHVNLLKIRLGACNRAETVSLAAALGYMDPEEEQ